MAMSEGRNSAFASSKFSRRTRETYSGSKAMCALRPQPAVEQVTLRVGGRRQRLEAPVLGRLDAERRRNALKLFAPRDEHRDVLARLVLLEPVVESIRAHAEVVDRQDLVVHIEARDVRG